MPSPFPGMDPCLEDPRIWPDFHYNLPPEIQGQLNQVIPGRYIARLNAYTTYELVEIEQTRAVRPDVAIWERKDARPDPVHSSTVATAAPVESRVALELPLRLLSVEVREVERMNLVAAIEILSPVNKRPGHDAQKDYLRKRRELLRSAAHLLEIDLLRAGERPPLEKAVPGAPYYVMLSRATDRPKVEVWPIQLWDRLPALPVPLLEPDQDAVLDLSAAVASVYERGRYVMLADYRHSPPPPSLSEAESRWLDEWLKTQGRR